MKRFIITLVTAIFAMTSMSICAFADNKEISVYLDGKKLEFDVAPQIVNGRTMVPMRSIFEKLGATVEWNDNGTVVCTKDDTTVKMDVSSADMYVNDKLTTMEAPPALINGRTLIPARYVAEALGSDVQWSKKNNTVVICSPGIYAYADYPDIPDLGRCYNAHLMNESTQDGKTVFIYKYNDTANDDHYSDIYDNSALALGSYSEDVVNVSDNTVTTAYTKPGETSPTYTIDTSQNPDGSMTFELIIPAGETPVAENKVTLYALDGRTIEVAENEVTDYLNVGWYKTIEETQQILYANDGRTLTVFKKEVPAYLNVGWHETLQETQQTLYAPDGRTLTVFRSEVPTYKNLGWYETKSAAQAANKPKTSTQKTAAKANPAADGYYYRTPTGKKYHLDPNCGGKNSYRTKDITGLSPCSKCVG